MSEEKTCLSFFVLWCWMVFSDTKFCASPPYSCEAWIWWFADAFLLWSWLLADEWWSIADFSKTYFGPWAPNCLNMLASLISNRCRLLPWLAIWRESYSFMNSSFSWCPFPPMPPAFKSVTSYDLLCRELSFCWRAFVLLIWLSEPGVLC